MKENIVLIGMPGCGKSTVGVLLAKALLRNFVDTDLIIQSRCGTNLCQIIDSHGIDGFKNIENSILAELHVKNSVIATGGSAVYCEDGMMNLKENGKTVYLKLSPEDILHRIDNITTRGIAMEKGCTIARLYAERAPLYERYADVTVDCTDMSIEDCVRSVKQALENM